MFSRAGPAAGNANRPRAFITAAPVPATEYNAICGTNNTRKIIPALPLCLRHARVGDRSREHTEQERPGRDHDQCQDGSRHEDAAEEPACEVSRAIMVAHLVASDDRRDEDRCEQRPSEELVVEEVRDRVQSLIRVAQVRGAEHRSDGDALPQSRRTTDDRPHGADDRIANQWIGTRAVGVLRQAGFGIHAHVAVLSHSTVGIVLMRIARSSAKDLVPTYSTSRSSASSIETALRPHTCQSPVMPGFTSKRRRW